MIEHVHSGEWCQRCVEHGLVEAVKLGYPLGRIEEALERIADALERQAALANWAAGHGRHPDD